MENKCPVCGNDLKSLYGNLVYYCESCDTSLYVDLYGTWTGYTGKMSYESIMLVKQISEARETMMKCKSIVERMKEL